jgi:hypothetical protein
LFPISNVRVKDRKSGDKSSIPLRDGRSLAKGNFGWKTLVEIQTKVNPKIKNTYSFNKRNTNSSRLFTDLGEGSRDGASTFAELSHEMDWHFAEEVVPEGNDWQPGTGQDGVSLAELLAGHETSQPSGECIALLLIAK